MTAKARALAEVHLGADGARQYVPDVEQGYDFGQLHGRARFTGTHPAVMRERIAACDWRVEPTTTQRKHDRPSQRALSFVENRVLGFRLAEHRNYVLIPPWAPEPRQRPGATGAPAHGGTG
jgi:hypothetical protein